MRFITLLQQPSSRTAIVQLTFQISWEWYSPNKQQTIPHTLSLATAYDRGQRSKLCILYITILVMLGVVQEHAVLPKVIIANAQAYVIANRTT